MGRHEFLQDALHPDRDPIDVGVRRCVALNRALARELRELNVEGASYAEALVTMQAQTLDAIECQMLDEAEGVA